MRLRRLREGHLLSISLQPVQVALRGGMTEAVACALARGPGLAVIDRGDVLACVGIVPCWPGRAVAWALLSDRIQPNRFLAVHRRVKAALDRHGMRHPWRIEIQVDPTHLAALRWAAMLGFLVEGRMRRYLPDGRDMILMARIP
jgi:hypothetical protein